MAYFHVGILVMKEQLFSNSERNLGLFFPDVAVKIESFRSSIGQSCVKS
jgi:hypothetical protein